MDCSVLLLWSICLRWKRVCIAHNNCMSCIDMSQLYLHCSLICTSEFLPVNFCEVISLSLGWNNPVRRCLPVGEAALSTPEAGGGFTHWLTDCFDVQPTTTSGNIITQSIISSFAWLTPSCILHRAQQHHAEAHLHVNVAIRQLQFSGIFVALGFVGNGVMQ